MYILMQVALILIQVASKLMQVASILMQMVSILVQILVVVQYKNSKEDNFGGRPCVYNKPV